MSIRVVLALLCLLPPAWAQDTPPPAELVDTAKARIYRVRLRVDRAWFTDAGQCQDLRADELRVALRGQRLADARSWHVERRTVDRTTVEPTLHALLIDISPSMLGKLPRAREAAKQYLSQLDLAHERALVVSFDQDAMLEHGPTADVLALGRAIDDLRIGEGTALNDAIVQATRELALHRERGVLVVLSDGMDNASRYDRRDVYDSIAEREDLTIFTIGLGLPPMSDSGPDGLISTRKFLQRLASTTNGEFLDVPTTSRLKRAYARVREMLDAEASLSVVDPEPEAEPGRLQVSSLRPGCSVRVVHEDRGDASGATISAGPTFPVIIDPLLADAYTVQAAGAEQPDCAEPIAIEVDATGIRGCILDVTMDRGVLYDPFQDGWLAINDWLRTRTRPIEVPVPPVADLPDSPALLFDALAAQARAAEGRPIDIDPRRRPADEHGRPHHDLSGLVHGNTFFDLRPALAQALYTRPDYRTHATAALRNEAGAELEEIRHRVRALAPQLSEAQLQQVLESSDAARQVETRVEHAPVADVERHLAAGLGDVPAHEVFVGWEQRRILQLLAGDDDADFVPGWTALHKIFWLPSYTRMLTLLAPGIDRASGHIGFWRVRLPRPSWLQERARSQHHSSDFSDLPLDLVPPLPLAYTVLRQLLEADPDAAVALGARELTEAHVSYELLGKLRHRGPRTAFRETRVTVELGEAGTEIEPALRLVADLALQASEPEILALQVSGTDAELVAALSVHGRP